MHDPRHFYKMICGCREGRNLTDPGPPQTRSTGKTKGVNDGGRENCATHEKRGTLIFV